MKKVNRFLLLFTIFALAGSIANVMANPDDIPTSILGEYVGELHVNSSLLGVDETFSGVTIELKESAPNYSLKVAEIDLGGGNMLPEYELDNVDITQSGNGYKLSRSESLTIIIEEIQVPPIPIFFPEGGTLYDVPATITLDDGYIENDILTLNITASATILDLIPVTVNIDFEGMLSFPDDCNPVTDAEAQIESCETATITWTDVTNASEYEIRRDGNLLGTVAASEFTETAEFEDGKSYTWTIKTICNENESDEVLTSATANCEICDSVTNAKAEIENCKTATVTWDAVDGANEYEIRRDENLLGTVTTPEFIETAEFEHGRYYFWEIKAICSKTESIGAFAVATSDCTGISDPVNSVSIYPNPSNTSVTINAKGFVKVEIYNTTGQLIEITDSNIVDVSSYNAGIYFFKIYDVNSNSVTKRIVVAR